MRLSEDFLIEQYKKLVEIVHAENCPIISQLALGAYYRDFEEIPENEMTTVEVKAVIKKFIDAAKRAEIAGFDGVQIHAAHFFFLSRFISPLVNQRSDQYGGNTENRTRILFEILRGIKNNSPNLHVTIKINCSDFTRGGLAENESLAICKNLAAAGIDSIEISGNGTSVAGIRAGVNEGYFSKFAARLADEISIPVICVGGWRSKNIMEKILNDTNIAALSISRPLLREPDFPKKLQRGEIEISKCLSCNACYSSPSHRCIFRK
jgi:2,4-dienoyl-CoA reductase-like NADH-dependent reductase (Old Yellow Enzyme family)